MCTDVKVNVVCLHPGQDMSPPLSTMRSKTTTSCFRHCECSSDAYLHEIAQHAVAAGGAALATASTSASTAAAAEDERVAALRHTVQRCIDAEPNRGELWCPLRKRTDLRRRSVAEVLLLAVEQEVLGFPIRYFTWTAPPSTSTATASST
jgi:hypothetical protein